MRNDTIAAIATPPGVGGIGIVRISGPEAFALIQPLFRRPGKDQSLPPTHQLTYGHLIDPATEEILDETLVVCMRAPRTYTAEDVVEVQGHGGPLVLQRILRTVLAQGARLANPGEFTLRSFLNGRLDLAQAESVMDLIGSQTEVSQRLALQQLQGNLSTQVQNARHEVLGVIAQIEASIDFPEEDVPTPGIDVLGPPLVNALAQVERLLKGADQGKLYRQGLRTAIVGRPNVGKSSLLNALLRSDRAIVTPIAGTTRDTVEEIANVRGIPLHLIDTAGITPTDDPVERIGVQRSRAAAESADLLLLVFDGSQPLSELDRQVCSEVSQLLSSQEAEGSKRFVLPIINKSDCEQQIDLEDLRGLWPDLIPHHTSTFTGQGLAELEEAIANLVLTGQTVQADTMLVTNTRHQEALNRARNHLAAGLQTLETGIPLDFVSIDVRAAYDALGEVTGETASEDLLDRIFRDFCIGK